MREKFVGFFLDGISSSRSNTSQLLRFPFWNPFRAGFYPSSKGSVRAVTEKVERHIGVSTQRSSRRCGIARSCRMRPSLASLAWTCGKKASEKDRG